MASPKKQTALHQKVRRRATKHVKLALVPHKANQFKPHLIRRHGLVAVLIVVIVAQFFGQGALFRGVLGDETTVTTNQLLADTNKERQAVGKAPLQLNRQLTDAAYLKAQDMLTHQYWDHTSPSGVAPWKWFGDVQYNYAYAGENLARNFQTSDEVVRAWMNSPSHRDNILKTDYQDVGFATVDGVMNGHAVSLVVALYGTPAASPAAGAVQGAQFVAPLHATPDILTRFGMSVQSMNPLTLGSVALVLLAAVVALIAHAYRRHIPKYLQNTWQRHHGLAKAVGLSSFAMGVVILYSLTGQI